MTNSKNIYCNFCDTHKDKAEKVFTSDGITHICSKCIKRAHLLLRIPHNKDRKIIQLWPTIPDKVS